MDPSRRKVIDQSPERHLIKCRALQVVTGLSLDDSRDLLVTCNWDVNACTRKFFGDKCRAFSEMTGLSLEESEVLLVRGDWDVSASASTYFEELDSGGDEPAQWGRGAASAVGAASGGSASTWAQPAQWDMGAASAVGAASGGPAVGGPGGSQVSMPVGVCSRALCKTWCVAPLCVGEKCLIAEPLCGVCLSGLLCSCNT